MAEHMLLMGVTDPQGEKTYVAAAFPSACGKTNFAMLIPPERYREAGWKVTTVGDDIAWMYVNPEDGRLWAINPEAGYFGVVPGTSAETNPNAMAIIAHDTIYTNVGAAARRRRLVGRQDAGAAAAVHRLDGAALDAGLRPTGGPSQQPLHRADERTTRSSTRTPMIPKGVPVSGIIFGGRRSTTMPLVFQAFNWIHGVYLGATLGSETTAAATGKVGVVRHDPMAMLPFCGYNINYYFVHWIRMRKHMNDCPRIFHVNWFRKRSGRQVPLARLRRKHARAQMDHRPLPGPGVCRGDAAGLDAARRRHQPRRHGPLLPRAIRSRPGPQHR